ncbi:MAG TPA: hypothetical protein ENG60_00705 [Thermoplasmatales archaeon]|nr:hypothetical protein [Thermoplasmatales archaeon]HEX16923.1 hypothetical protein [Thermoplasmatales archaeon]
MVKAEGEVKMYSFVDSPKKPEDFITTGVDKLDALLEGGIPKGFMTLILSVPGSGCEILFKQIASSGDCLVFSTQETEEEIITTMKRFGWNPNGVEIVDIATRYTETILLSQEKRVSIYQKRAGIDLKELIAESSGSLPKLKEREPDFLAMLGDRLKESKLPRRIILYTLDFFLDQYPQGDVIKTVHAMKVANLRNGGALFIFMTKGVYGELFERRMEGIADCVIELDVLKKGSTFDRYLAIKKMRNYARKIGMARYTIEDGGFVLEMIERIL